MLTLKNLFIVLFSLMLLGCSILPPEPPEPKGELKPINIVNHKDAYN